MADKQPATGLLDPHKSSAIRLFILVHFPHSVHAPKGDMKTQNCSFARKPQCGNKALSVPQQSGFIWGVTSITIVILKGVLE